MCDSTEPPVRLLYLLLKIEKLSAVSTADGWLKLNVASCVIRKTRSLGALVLCSICNTSMVFVNDIRFYHMVVGTQFHKFYGRPFTRSIFIPHEIYLQNPTVQCGVVRCGVARCGVVRCGAVRCCAVP